MPNDDRSISENTPDKTSLVQIPSPINFINISVIMKIAPGIMAAVPNIFNNMSSTLPCKTFN